jgi:hypothetical protein
MTGEDPGDHMIIIMTWDSSIWEIDSSAQSSLVKSEMIGRMVPMNGCRDGLNQNGPVEKKCTFKLL